MIVLIHIDNNSADNSVDDIDDNDDEDDYNLSCINRLLINI